jgi:hypothetical protein
VELDIKEIITVVIAVAVPTVLAVLGFIWRRLERLESRIDDCKKTARQSEQLLSAEVKEDIKGMAESMLKTIDTLDARISELMFNMINDGRK